MKNRKNLPLVKLGNPKVLLLRKNNEEAKQEKLDAKSKEFRDSQAWGRVARLFFGIELFMSVFLRKRNEVPNQKKVDTKSEEFRDSQARGRTGFAKIEIVGKKLLCRDSMFMVFGRQVMRENTCLIVLYRHDNLDEPFQMMGIELRQQLSQHWPSCRDAKKYKNQLEASPWLWRHEYMTHGSCARDYFGISLIDYFQLVLEFSKIKIEKSLLVAGILEGSASTYTTGEISKAIDTYLGITTNVKFSCRKDTDELMEILLCIDGITRQLMTCPNYNRDFKCKNPTVIFLRNNVH